MLRPANTAPLTNTYSIDLPTTCTGLASGWHDLPVLVALQHIARESDEYVEEDPPPNPQPLNLKPK